MPTSEGRGRRHPTDERFLLEMQRMRENGECDVAKASILIVALAERIADRRSFSIDTTLPPHTFEQACDRLLVDVLREYGEIELAEDFASDPGFFRLRHEIARERLTNRG